METLWFHNEESGQVFEVEADSAEARYAVHHGCTPVAPPKPTKKTKKSEPSGEEGSGSEAGE